MKLLKRNKWVLMATLCGSLLLGACASDEEDATGDDGEEVTEEDIGTRGSMEDFQVGDTFVATEPIDISLFYRDMSAYPYDPDWQFFEVLSEEHNVNLRM
ncbi:MAG: fimbrillin family protein [Alkalibacterium sp.]|nr:fimbrillin family protein [Alkalibacterium sp.]